MIHIIVYSTTDTVAKMYKIKEEKKRPFQSNSGGRGEWLTLLQYTFQAVGEAPQTTVLSVQMVACSFFQRNIKL